MHLLDKTVYNTRELETQQAKLGGWGGLRIRSTWFKR